MTMSNLSAAGGSDPPATGAARMARTRAKKKRPFMALSFIRRDVLLHVPLFEQQKVRDGAQRGDALGDAMGNANVEVGDAPGAAGLPAGEADGVGLGVGVGLGNGGIIFSQ